MVLISIFGKVLEAPRAARTQNGVQRVFFEIMSEDEGSYPFKYECVSFGTVADRILNEVGEGDKIFVSGRLTAVPRRVNLAVSSFEAATEGVPANAEPR